MADAPAKSKTALLTKKKGPLPVWAWLALATVAGWYLWKKLGSNIGSTNPAAATPQDTSASGGLPATDNSGGTSGGVASGGITADELASALGAQQSGFAQALAQSQSDLLTQIEDYWSSNPYGNPGGEGSGSPPGDGSTPSTSPQPGGSNAPMYHHVAASTPNFGAAALRQTNTLAAAGKQAAYGGVTSVKRLANGSTVTTYASGRKVQQAPGKSAYVIHK